jgi:hypothetical protein
MRATVSSAFLVAMLGPASLAAQTPDPALAVQGTMSLNAIWNRAQSVTFPGANSAAQFGEMRFGGRAAARVQRGLFVGVSVVSWQFDYARFKTGRDVDAVSEGVVVGPYLQFYPVRQLPAFVRAGGGYANTWAFNGSGSSIQGFRGNRAAVSIGAGADVPLRAHLALTLSLDYTQLFHAQNFAEATSAIVAGVGLTVR